MYLLLLVVVVVLVVLDVARGKPERRRYCMQHAGNPRDGGAACMGPLSPFIAELRMSGTKKSGHVVNGAWVTDA